MVLSGYGSAVSLHTASRIDCPLFEPSQFGGKVQDRVARADILAVGDSAPSSLGIDADGSESRRAVGGEQFGTDNFGAA